MKILYITTIGSTMGFFKSLIHMLLNEGHTVDIACNVQTCDVPAEYRKWGCRVFPMPWSRSPFDLHNISAISKLKEVIKNGEYDIVHCHTPVAAACTRIACKPFRKQGLKVIYTAHGFHFYKGAPLLNWLIYYPIEYLLSYYTDVLITINHEDYNRSLTFHAKQNVYISGVGVNLAKFHIATPDEKLRKRLQLNLGLKASDIVCVCVGELNKNKNQLFIIKNIERLLSTYPQLKLVIVGSGKEYITLDAYIKNNGLAANVFLLGYRTDICDILNASDFGISASVREGLGVNVIEFVASGLKVICADNRGHRDIAEHTHVLIYKQSDSDDFVKILRECINNKNIDSHDKNDISSFAEENVIFQLNQLYKNTSS